MTWMIVMHESFKLSRSRYKMHGHFIYCFSVFQTLLACEQQIGRMLWYFCGLKLRIISGSVASWILLIAAPCAACSWSVANGCHVCIHVCVTFWWMLFVTAGLTDVSHSLYTQYTRIKINIKPQVKRAIWSKLSCYT